jgi:hypothetical protein
MCGEWQMPAVAQAPQVPNVQALAGNTKPAVALKITKVETIPLHIPFKVAFEFAAGTRPFLEVLLVRLHTDAALVGVGETQAWRRQGSSETLGNIARNIRDFFEQHLVGRSPFDIADIMGNLDAALDHALYSKAPISDALYDLQGQALGLPLYQLFGGKVREAIPVCAILSIKKTPEATVENAQAFYDRGFRAFTVKIGIDPVADLVNVRALRQHFGAEVVLRVDANAGMDFDGALALLQKLAPYDIDVAEQPISMWDVEGLAELARRHLASFADKTRLSFLQKSADSLALVFAAVDSDGRLLLKLDPGGEVHVQALMHGGLDQCEAEGCAATQGRRHRKRCLQRLSFRRYFVDQSDTKGLFRFNGFCQQQHRQCVGLADKARQTLGGARPGDRPDPAARDGEGRAGAGDAQVASQRKFASASEAKAFNGGDDRLAQVLERGIQQMERPEVTEALGGRAHLDRFRKIGAGRKAIVVPRDDDGADVGIGLEGERHFTNLGHHLEADRVAFGRPVQRNDSRRVRFLHLDRVQFHDVSSEILG